MVCSLLIGSVADLVQAADATTCRQFYDQVDKVVDRAKIRDAQDDPLKNHPYLRSNRFIASLFAHDLSAPQFDFVLQQMRALDRNARRIELNNLPNASRALLDRIRGEWLADQNDNDQALEVCAQILIVSQNHSPEKMKQQISPPARYSLFKRIVGLYPLTAIPFSRGIRKFQAGMSQTFAKPLNDTIDATRLKTYAAPKAEPIDVAAILRAASVNPLSIPLPDAQQRMQLLTHFAPNFAVDTRGDFDQIGTVKWDASGQIKIDPATAQIYSLLSHTTIAGQTLLQLNYMIWFSERPKKERSICLAARWTV